MLDLLRSVLNKVQSFFGGGGSEDDFFGEVMEDEGGFDSDYPGDWDDDFSDPDLLARIDTEPGGEYVFAFPNEQEAMNYVAGTPESVLRIYIDEEGDYIVNRYESE